MKMLLTYLTDLMDLLQPGRIDRSHVAMAELYRTSFDSFTGGRAWRSNPPPHYALPVHSTAVALSALLRHHAVGS
ncbi:hypothetical protein Q4610_08455 [Sphingobium sp. HBC34]|uniref:Uncharacterized protein n=1 Tax=Sphingobium cyanobacteriorum TaxID=3063954 RepID=A0ABT8ZKL7_9SPHN|nr:hypothetical protein [Sphingobium sp. HBC34]